MVGFPSDKPIDQEDPQESDEEMENPHESGEENENPQESGGEKPQAESIEKTPKLCDDVTAQESQVEESDESSPIVSGLPTSSSAINEDNVDQDDPQESDEEKENPQEESIENTPELCDDVVAQEPQAKDSDESTSIVSDLLASSSAINETELTETVEANKKTDPSSSRSGEISETDEIKTGDKEDDRNDDDDSKDSEFPYPNYEEEEDEYRDETSSLISQPEEILSTLSLYENPNRSSESEMCQVMVPPQQNLGLGGLDPQSSYQISRSDRMVNQQQQFTIPNQPFVMQPPLPTMMFTTQPRPFVVDHNYGAGFDPMAAPWRPPNIIPQGPRNIYPTFNAPLRHMLFAMTPPIVAVRSSSDRPSGMQHQMDTDPNIVRAIALRKHLQTLEANPQYQTATHLPMIPVTNEQNRIVAFLDQGPAPMMPMMYQNVQMRPEANQQDEIAPNLLMRPENNQQNQIVPYLAPGQAPMMHQHMQMIPEANQQDQIAPNLLMRPENNQQNQIVPYLAPGQAPVMQAPMMPRMYVEMRPETNRRYQIVPNLHMRPILNQQNQIVAFRGPLMPVMYQLVQMRPEANQQYQNVPNLLPEANQQNRIFVPYLAPGQAPATPIIEVMIPETIQQNQTDTLLYPAPVMYYPHQQLLSPDSETITLVPSGLPRSLVVNMIDQASPNAAAAPMPEHNQPQMLQLQSQTQLTTQSQWFDVGSSSDQNQD